MQNKIQEVISQPTNFLNTVYERYYEQILDQDANYQKFRQNHLKQRKDIGNQIGNKLLEIIVMQTVCLKDLDSLESHEELLMKLREKLMNKFKLQQNCLHRLFWKVFYEEQFNSLKCLRQEIQFYIAQLKQEKYTKYLQGLFKQKGLDLSVSAIDDDNKQEQQWEFESELSFITQDLQKTTKSGVSTAVDTAAVLNNHLCQQKQKPTTAPLENFIGFFSMDPKKTPIIKQQQKKQNLNRLPNALDNFVGLFSMNNQKLLFQKEIDNYINNEVKHPNSELTEFAHQMACSEPKYSHKLQGLIFKVKCQFDIASKHTKFQQIVYTTEAENPNKKIAMTQASKKMLRKLYMSQKQLYETFKQIKQKKKICT